MSLHAEISFEDEICDDLAAHDWPYEAGSASLVGSSRTWVSERVQCFAVHVLRRSVRNRKEFDLSVGQRRLTDLDHSVGPC
jgi:hypothetical protein